MPWQQRRRRAKRRPQQSLLQMSQDASGPRMQVTPSAKSRVAYTRSMAAIGRRGGVGIGGGGGGSTGSTGQSRLATIPSRPQLRHSPPPPATHRHISQYSGYTARSPQPPPVHHQHNHQYQQQQHEGYHSGYHSGYSSDVGSDRDIAGSYGNRTYGGGGADADAAAAAAAAADSDGRYSNSGGRVAMGKKARNRRKRKPPPFTSYTSNGRASSTSPAAPFPSRSPSPAPLGQGLYEPTSRELQLAQDEAFLNDRRGVAAALKGAGSLPSGEGSGAALSKDVYSKIYDAFVYDSFVIQVEAPAKPPAKSGAPFQWDLQDLFGGSVTQPLGHGQSFVFGELPRFSALPPPGASLFHKEPLRPPVLPGINIEHIGGGASEPATPGSASYNAEMERRRREAQEDQLYGKQLGEKIRIHTDMTQFQALRAAYTNHLKDRSLKKQKCKRCNALAEMAREGTYPFRRIACDVCGKEVYYPDLPVRKRAVKRWKKAAIAITRGTDEANRIFDNPHGTADETDVFGAARDTVFGNDTLKQEQRDDPNSGYNVVVAVRAAANLEEEASKEKAKKVQQDMLKAEESMLKTEESMLKTEESMLEGEESMLKAEESMLEAEEAHEEMQDDAAALLAEKFVKDKVQAIREAAEKMYAEEEAAIQIENTKAALMEEAQKIVNESKEQMIDLLSPLTDPIIELVGEDVMRELLEEIVIEDQVTVDYTETLLIEALNEMAAGHIVDYREEQIANDSLFGNVRTSKSARARVEAGTQSLLDYLYMFCLISTKDIEEFRRAFDAADQDHVETLDTKQTVSALAIACGTSAVEFLAVDVAGYLDLLAGSAADGRVPFHLFTIIAAMSRKIVNVLQLSDGDQMVPAGTTLGDDGVRTLPDGTKLLLDGTVILLNGVRMLPNGNKRLINGTLVRADGTKILPDGRKVMVDGKVFMPNGAAAEPLTDEEIEVAGGVEKADRPASASASGYSTTTTTATTTTTTKVFGAAGGVPTNATREGVGVEFTAKCLLKKKESTFKLGRQLLVMLRRAKQYFYLCNVDRADGKVPLNDVEAELVAGQMDANEVSMVVRGMKQSGLSKIGFLDFLDYAPLFAQIHDNIVENPMSLDEKALLLNVIGALGQTHSAEEVTMKAASKWHRK